MRKRGFTMIELILVIVIISLGLVVVLEGISRSMSYLRKTKNEIIAINLAREGMEVVYNIRNTNRLRRSGARDEHRLRTDSLDSSSEWMKAGNYILLNEPTHRKLVPNTSSYESANKGYNDVYELCLSSENKYISDPNCPDEQLSQFYRVIIGKGLYSKGDNQKLNCTGNNDSDTRCTDDSAKEYRFCSRVSYGGGGIPTNVEFCGAITNFLN